MQGGCSDPDNVAQTQGGCLDVKRKLLALQDSSSQKPRQRNPHFSKAKYTNEFYLSLTKSSLLATREGSTPSPEAPLPALSLTRAFSHTNTHLVLCPNARNEAGTISHWSLQATSDGLYCAPCVLSGAGPSRRYVFTPQDAQSTLLGWQLSQEQQRPERRLTAWAARRRTRFPLESSDARPYCSLDPMS